MIWSLADEPEKSPEQKNTNATEPKTLEVIRNRIYFYAEIDRDNVLRLAKALREKVDSLLYLAAVDSYPGLPPIHLHIQSYGGGVFSGLSAMDNILLFRDEVPIITVVDGYCASAATFLSLVGTKRLITEHSYMLIHQLSSGMWGKYEELKDDMMNAENLMKRIRGIYNKHAKIPAKKLKEILKHDLWFDAKTCLEYGLVDEIIGSKK
jgi:ATP-dependent protease ClpP protease subunit